MQCSTSRSPQKAICKQKKQNQFWEVFNHTYLKSTPTAPLWWFQHNKIWLCLCSDCAVPVLCCCGAGGGGQIIDVAGSFLVCFIKLGHLRCEREQKHTTMCKIMRRRQRVVFVIHPLAWATPEMCTREQQPLKQSLVPRPCQLYHIVVPFLLKRRRFAHL